MSYERDIDSVIETVRNAPDGCALLVGAGVSVKAGIPLASGFVKQIEEAYPTAYKRAKAKTYAHCMAELTPADRHKLITDAVSNSKVNWAHLALSQLIKAKQITRVLTTNFDPLIMRACALVGVYPAIYDFAASEDFRPAFVPDLAIFHLHGQHSGFVQLHTEADVRRHHARLKPVFEDTGTGRPWIVVGYSGRNDPVFEHLAAIPSFDHGLYWISYEKDPPAHVASRLLADARYACHVGGQDADAFFVALARALKCFPPDFIVRPFSHLKCGLAQLTPFEDGEGDEVSIVETARSNLDAAIERFETCQIQRRGAETILEGYLSGVNKVQNARFESPATTALRAWSLVSEGDSLSAQAKGRNGGEADRLFAEAYEKYARAVQIAPDKHEAYTNWGCALSDQAKTKVGKERDSLFVAAFENFERAAALRPAVQEIFNNWGLALSEQATMKSRGESDRLFVEAYEKFAYSVKIRPDLRDGFYKWGVALFQQARQMAGNEADKVFAQAYEKWAHAIQIKHDDHQSLNNWGLALSEQAKMKGGSEASGLLVMACEKFSHATKIEPQQYEGWYNWGNALAEQAKAKTDAKSEREADKLFAEAYECYSRACKIKPNEYGPPHNWGLALVAQARSKNRSDADQLLAEACEKYALAVQINPDDSNAPNSWGAALMWQAIARSGSEADRLFAEAYKKYERALHIEPDKRDAFFNWGLSLGQHAMMKHGLEADELFVAAYGKYAHSVQTRPEDYEALNWWGLSLARQARTKSGAEANNLLTEACEKYERAVQIGPNRPEILGNFGSALLELSKTRSGHDAEMILGRAKEKLMLAEGIRPGTGAYDLACTEALLGDPDSCRRWLTVACDAGTLPSREHLLDDPDLTSVRELAWFANFVQ